MSIVNFSNHVRNLADEGNVGKEFTPISVRSLGDSCVVVDGTCPEYNGEKDEICVEWNNGCYYWVDFDRFTPIGSTAEAAYDTMINYIGRIAKVTSNFNNPIGPHRRNGRRK